MQGPQGAVSPGPTNAPDYTCVCMLRVFAPAGAPLEACVHIVCVCVCVGARAHELKNL